MIGQRVRMKRRTFIASSVVLLAAPGIVRAQAYPARPVRMIVPFGPGGNADVFGRIIAQKLSERLGEQFYVENVSGAGGNIGVGRAAMAAPDGYTVLVTPPSFTINPALHDKVPYDARTSFDAVTLAVSTSVVLAANPSVPAQTLKELAALIKSNPGKFNYATAGVGSPGHIVGEMLRQSLGVDLLHIPYNSAALAIGATVAGHTTMCLAAPAPIVPQVGDGQLRALAMAYRRRLHALADVPTTAEAGYPDIEFDNWFGVFVPAVTHPDIIALLNREIVRSMSDPGMRAHLLTLGLEPIGSTPAEFSRQVAIELEKWAKVVRAANIRTE
ncbi:hypothetical protein BraRD5C2_77190 [Bradyrhizobium sp. RD5-C2]|nr:hypothetical protein BraRD5C2_77190 [Bradyrhizobium sp. RD5-C2]